MGYYVQSYLTNATELKTLYGSKNQDLFVKLAEELNEDLDDINDDFEDYLNEKIDAKEILRDIVNGETRFPNQAFAYGYVYEKLVAHFGELFYPPNDEYSTDYYWEIEKKETYKAFIPIPFSDDFPEIYSIKNEDLEKEKTLFLNAGERSNKMDEETVKIEKEDFEFAFDQAKLKNKDLVFFLY